MILHSNDELTHLVIRNGVNTFSDLIDTMRNIPYGRNLNRTDFKLVITENRGTCSSKHALIKEIADLNNVPNVDLILAIYKMNNSNTPGIGSVLDENKLDFIPEAHCYLMHNGKRLDITTAQSEIGRIEQDIISETSINPEQVGQYKVDLHRTFLENWLDEQDLNLSIEELWKIREECISNLSI